MKRNRSFIVSYLLLFFFFLPIPPSALGQPAAYYKFAFDFFHGERGTLIRYGNWYGPGWWGGSEDPRRVGMLPPVDALDKIAQKHDFGYQLAEELGGSHPEIVAYYKALADAIAVKDAQKLSTNPVLWSPPAKNIALARRYHQRIAVGFKDIVKNFNALLAAFPKKLYGVDPEAMEIILNGRVSPDDFEARALRLVSNWESKYRSYQAQKAANLKPVVPTKKVDPQVTASTFWVLSSVKLWSDNPDFEKVKKQYQESPAGVIGKVSPGLSLHSWVNPNRSGAKTVLSVTWNAPAPQLKPGEDIIVAANAADAGCDSNAGEGDFVFFNMNLFGSHDGKAWELVSSGGPDFYANPFKQDTRVFKLPVPKTAYKQLLLKVESGNGFLRDEAVGYFYDFTSTKTAGPSAQVIESGVLNKRALTMPQPVYPDLAKMIRIAGTVSVQVIVNEDGAVVSAEADEGHPLLRDAAVTAARNARFSPPTQNGKPVRLSGILVYDIRPPD